MGKPQWKSIKSTRWATEIKLKGGKAMWKGKQKGENRNSGEKNKRKKFEGTEHY